MKRRSFLKTTGTLLFGAAVTPVSLAAISDFRDEADAVCEIGVQLLEKVGNRTVVSDCCTGKGFAASTKRFAEIVVPANLSVPFELKAEIQWEDFSRNATITGVRLTEVENLQDAITRTVRKPVLKPLMPVIPLRSTPFLIPGDVLTINYFVSSEILFSALAEKPR